MTNKTKNDLRCKDWKDLISFGVIIGDQSWMAKMAYGLLSQNEPVYLIDKMDKLTSSMDSILKNDFFAVLSPNEMSCKIRDSLAKKGFMDGSATRSYESELVTYRKDAGKDYS